MSTVSSPPPPAALLPRAALAAALCLAAASGTARGASLPWVGIGLTGGAVAPDPHLADYRWDAGAHGLAGAEVLAGVRSISGGLRVSTWTTAQSLGSAAPAPEVRLTAVDLVGRLRLLSAAGFSLWGTASGGRISVRYRPDRAVLEIPGTDPIPVAFEPETAWTWGLGIGLERGLPGGFVLGAEADRSAFALDTAHREGDRVVRERESFRNWSVKLRLFWKLRTF